MEMLLNEVLTETEIRVRYENEARKQQEAMLARIATRNRLAGVDATWASITAGLDRLAEKGSYAVRSVLTGPSRPNEECC